MLDKLVLVSRAYRLLYNLESHIYYEYMQDGTYLKGSDLRDRALLRGSYRALDAKHQQRADHINDVLPSASLDCVHQHVIGNYKAAMANKHNIDGAFVMKKKDDIMMFKVTSHGWSITDDTVSILPSCIGLKKCRRVFSESDFSLMHMLSERPTVTISIINHRIYVDVPLNQAVPTNLSSHIVAFDPGLRSFIVTANSAGTIEDLGKEIVSIANRTARRIYKRPKPVIPEDASKRLMKKLQRQIDAIDRLKAKTDRRIDDIQTKLAKMMALRYRVVISSNISLYLARSQKGLNRLIQRFVNHCNFIKRLKNACERYGSDYVETKEYYTSQCCSQCCSGKYKPEKRKSYTCPEGCPDIDRDVNGARNILMRFMAMTGSF